TVYRRIVENLATAEAPPSAFRDIIDGWFHVLEEDAVATGLDRSDDAAVQREAAALLDRRLDGVTRAAPSFATALRGYRRATLVGDVEQAEGVLGWLGGQPHVAAAAKRSAGVRGDLDHFGALAFL